MAMKRVTDDTMKMAQAADAVLFGAVGGPKWANVPYEARPEAGADLHPGQPVQVRIR